MDEYKKLEGIRPRTGEVIKQRVELGDRIEQVEQKVSSLKSKLRRIGTSKK